MNKIPDVPISYDVKFDPTLVPCSGLTSLDVLMLMGVALLSGVLIGFLVFFWRKQ